MPAERDFDFWREPPQLELAGAARNQERGFRQVHFAAKQLQPFVRRPAREQAHRRGVAREWLVCKCIHDG